MTDKDIDKIPITVEVPKPDVWVRNDYRDIVRRLGEVHMIRACEYQHDDDFVPLYDIEMVFSLKEEIERLRDCISAREVRSLVDERDRLRAERDDVRAELSNLQIAFNEWMRSETERQVQKGKRLDEEIGRLRPDAERYRWLRNEHQLLDPLCRVVWKAGNDRLESNWVEVVDIDAATDAAMKGEKP